MPPIIFLAMYRADSVAKDFGTLGYLVSIIASLTFAMAPRARFLQQMMRHLILTLIAAPISILGLWCARQAKNHTQAASDPTLFNSSAAAISAVFLFFNAFWICALRAVFYLPYLADCLAIPQADLFCCSL
jgi:hypothetical protein